MEAEDWEFNPGQDELALSELILEEYMRGYVPSECVEFSEDLNAVIISWASA